MKAACLLLALSLWPSIAVAQSTDGRVEVSGGLRRLGADRFPEVASTQTRVGGTSRDVFVTSTEIEAFPALDVKLGFGLSPAFQLEGGVVIGTSNVTTAVTGDVEGVSNVSASTPISHYGFEGSAVARLGRRGRLTPFVLAGAGYFRQVQDGDVLVDTGRSYHVGAGGDFRWRRAPQARIRSAGLRLDVRVLVQQGGLSEDETRTLPTFGASVYVRF